MNTLELYLGKTVRRFSGPSSWAELSPRQAVALVRLRASIVDRPEGQFPALQLLYKIPPRFQRWLFDGRFLTHQGVDQETIETCLVYGQDLLDTLLWVGEPDEKASFPVKSFRRFDFKYGNLRVLVGRLFFWKRYHGPTAGLSDISFGEFMFADQALRSGNLPLLAAILYRPKGEPFDKALADQRASLFAELDPALLGLISQNFSDSMSLLSRYFKRVFSPADPSAPSNTKGAAGSSGWLSVAIGLAKLDVTKIAQIEQTNLYLALKVLDEQIRQADELERELDKRRS